MTVGLAITALPEGSAVGLGLECAAVMVRGDDGERGIAATCRLPPPEPKKPISRGPV